MMAAGTKKQNYDDIEERDLGGQKPFLYLELLQKFGLVNHGWSPAGALSRIRPEQNIGRRETIALPLSSATQRENACVAGPTDESSDTELVVNKHHDNTPGPNNDTLPDVVILTSGPATGPCGRHKQGTAMSKNKKPTMKRTVSFDEGTRHRLTKGENVDIGDKNEGVTAARRRVRSSGYGTGGSRESDVDPTEILDDVFPQSPAPGCTSTLPDVQEHLGPQFPGTAGREAVKTDRECMSNSGDDISEDGEGSSVETGSDVGNSLNSTQSSFMLPAFELLGTDIQTVEAAPMQQSESLGVDPDAAPGRTCLRYDDMAEMLLEAIAPDPILLDENDLLLEQFRREFEEESIGIEEDKITRMMQEGASLDQMERAIASQLPSEVHLPVPVSTDNPTVISPVDKEITHRLQMAAQCDNDGCDFPPCRQGKQELAGLEKYLSEWQTNPSCYENERKMLRYLMEHAEDCDYELRCTVPWCQFIHEFCHVHRSDGDGRLERLRRCLYQEYFSGYHDYSLSSDSCEVIQLQGDSPPERLNCEVLSRLAPYTDVLLVIELITSPQLSSRCCVTKKLEHFEDSQVDLLRKLNHPQIVAHHWLHRNDKLNTAILCTQFHGDSVCHWLKTRHPRGCRCVCLIQTVLSHVLSAVTYLHSVNILYLAWTGSDVALGYTCNDVIQAKLCDFSHAVSLERELDEDDEEDIRQHLLPAIVPPERPLSLDRSDQWGLGCLLYEIALGHKVHSASVHEDPETQRTAAEEMPDLRELDRVNPAVAAVIKDCLKMLPGERPTIDQLQQLRLDI